MTEPSQFTVRPAEIPADEDEDGDGDAHASPGAYACFPYDRALVERFRGAFPRARWREAEGCWWVPGTRARDRVDRWLAGELAQLDRHGEAKGRDAYLFDPLESRYLEVGDDLAVRTPYSRTVVDTMRGIPWARWDPEGRAWRVPFRSYDALRARWPTIEDAARRNEPEARRRRAEERKGDAAALAAARERERERRRHRFPAPLDEPPPLEVPVATEPYGVVVFTGSDGEVVDAEGVPALYAHAQARPGPFAWLAWRLPTWREVAAARPAEADPDARERRGWSLPTREELQDRRRAMRRAERAQEIRAARDATPADEGDAA